MAACASAFLSKPAASPTGEGKPNPATLVVSEGGKAGGRHGEAGPLLKRKSAIIMRCARSASRRKTRGRRIG